MLALVKEKEKQKVVLQHCDDVKIEDGDVLIKVDYCGICGSDLHAYHHSKGYEFVQAPIILGHEISGVVIEVANETNQHLVGKNVIVESMHYCGTCENCKEERYSICLHNQVLGLHFNGGMAQFVKTKATYVREIKNGLSNQIASLSEPMAVAVHAVKRAGEINENHVVLVQGPGVIGFFVGLVCAQKGAKVILSGLQSDYEHRLSKASQFRIVPHIADQDPLLEKVDVVFECSGSEKAATNSLNYLKKGGRAVLVAMYENEVELLLTKLVRNEWPLLPSYGCDPQDYEEAMNLLLYYENKLKEIVRFYPIEEGSKAFEDSSNRDVFKAVISVNIPS